RAFCLQIWIRAMPAFLYGKVVHIRSVLRTRCDSGTRRIVPRGAGWANGRNPCRQSIERWIRQVLRVGELFAVGLELVYGASPPRPCGTICELDGSAGVIRSEEFAERVITAKAGES